MVSSNCRLCHLRHSEATGCCSGRSLNPEFTLDRRLQEFGNRHSPGFGDRNHRIAKLWANPGGNLGSRSHRRPAPPPLCCSGHVYPPNYRRVINRAQSSRRVGARDGISARIYFREDQPCPPAYRVPEPEVRFSGSSEVWESRTTGLTEARRPVMPESATYRL